MNLLSSLASACLLSSCRQTKEPPYRVNHYIPTPTLIDYPHTKAGGAVNPALDADCCGRTVASAFKSAFIFCVCAKEISTDSTQQVCAQSICSITLLYQDTVQAAALTAHTHTVDNNSFFFLWAFIKLELTLCFLTVELWDEKRGRTPVNQTHDKIW